MVGNQDDNANQESLLLTVDLVRTAIFNVCYIRGVFPDMYFGRKRVAALDMKINKLLPMDTDSRRLISWIEKGVFDSLQKNYLKTLVFCIREKIDGPIIEEYSFSFSYSSGCVRMNIHLIGKEKHGGIYDITPNQMKSSARKLVRSLIQSMDMLGTLPDERTILMKLICYDDVTPADYKPPLFRGWTEEEEAQYVWTKNPLTMDLKTVNMKHLLLTLKVKSVLDPCADENDDMQHDEKSTRRYSVHDEADITNKESLSLQLENSFLPDNNKHGSASYVEGGMGSVSIAIASAAKESGAQIFTNAEVSEVLTEDSSVVKGVLLADGTRVESSVILSNATPYRTFVELVPTNNLPEKFVSAIKNSDYSSATTKINMAVDKLPQFQCCKTNNHSRPGPEHFGTIHIGAENMDEVHSACHDAENGIPSRRPVIEMTIPSSLDNTISPPGKHVINLFIQYTPYKPSDGTWEDPAYRDAFAQRCFKLIDEYAPGFSSSIISYDMLTPPDLEREIGLTGGNIFHGAMGLDSLFLMRPVKGWSNYKSPLKGLYLCGSGAHPGGGVMGAPGRNAAHVVLQDLKRIQRE